MVFHLKIITKRAARPLYLNTHCDAMSAKQKQGQDERNFNLQSN
jgi:hypothetical protein